MGSAIGDIDNDGDFDWFVTSIYEEGINSREGNRLYEYFGFDIFLDSTDKAGVREGHWGWGAAFLDADLDGDLDLAQTNGVVFPEFPEVSFDFHEDQSIFWENDGTGVFTDISNAAGITDTKSGKGLLTFDYDNDGDLDIFIVNNGDTPILYRNDTFTDNDYLIVRTRGTTDNAQGLGAIVKMIVDETSPDQIMIRQIEAGSQFLGQSEVMAHFGLGDLTTIDRVEVTWPDGTVDVYFDVSPNSVLEVIQVSGLQAGDLNGDGAVTNGDIAAFVQALTDPAGYASAFPHLDADVLGDFDGSGTLTNGDIAAFVAPLTGSGAAVPEPTSLAAVGLVGLLITRRRR